ncbi:MAG: serine/threonine protein phosphatase [Gammaproteobacteria bacterium]|nr:serine/threonine protein phosphatase [Gammaproteobacteria bacterium]
MFCLKTKPFDDIQIIKDIPFPADLKFRALLVTGPPGSGKSTFVRNLGGWSEEGYANLSMDKWWTAQSLALRPREIHLGFPFFGIDEALTVFDPQYIEASSPLQLDFERILIPPIKQYFWSVDWCKRYAFEFILPPATTLLKWRLERAKKGTHYVDKNVTLVQIEQQLHIYHTVAQYLAEQGLFIYIRESHQDPPLQIIIE